MASGGGGKRGSKKAPTAEELAAELTKLKLENKQLKSKLKEHHGEDNPILTATAKHALVSNLVSGLTRVAAKKIEERVVKATAKATTKRELEESVKELSMRISLSVADLGERSTSGTDKETAASESTLKTSPPQTRARSKSRGRSKKE